MFTLHAFHPTRGRWSETDLAALAGLLADPEVTVWLDLQDPTSDEARVLGDVFAFHSLAIEDMLHDYGHPKLDVYDDHVFLIVHAIDFQTLDIDGSFRIDTCELDIFAGERYLITHHTGPLKAITELHRDVREPGHRPWVAVRLLHRMLDRVVDNYLPVMDRIGARIEQLEDQIIHRPEPEHLERVLDAKKSIGGLRRITGHQRMILESLARGHIALIPRDSIAFFRDIYDHFVRVADLADAYREGAQAVAHAYLSASANKTNEIMKALTQISTVMLPLTFIAGIYGMNFSHMPELGWAYGYPFALGLMAVTACGLLVWFRRRHWL